MKRITLLFSMLLVAGFSWHGHAQVLNQSANWPNATWTVTGTYNADPLAFEADPTATANFAFDDDDAGNGSDDSIAAESPVIDLTPSATAGETWIKITVDYGYNYIAEDLLEFQYYDADAAMWVSWENASLPDNGSAVDDFCTIPKTTYVTNILDVSGFTPIQLSGFRYRIFYDDDPAGDDWNYGFCFDSPIITSETPPTCLAPSGLAVNSITATTADLSWTENGTATLWDVEIVLAGTLPTGTPTDTGVTNPFVATGLNPCETYEFYVRADCGGGDVSAFSGPVAFTTASGPVGNFSENFDALPEEVLPACWTNIINSTSTFASADTDGGNSFSDPNNLEFYDSGDDAAELFVITPVLTDLPSGTHQMRFQARADSDAILEIGTMTDPLDESTFTLVQAIAATDNYQEFIVPFDAGTTDTYIAFRGTFTGTYSDSNIDNVFWETIPTCPKPNTLTVSNILDTQADLGWTDSGTATIWDVHVVPTGDPTPTSTTVPSDPGVTNPYTKTGLTASTAYDFYVRADCGGGDVSRWSGPFSFTTPCSVTVPDYTEDFTTVLPDCWEEAGSGTPATGFSDLGFSDWDSEEFLNTGSNTAVAINLYSDFHEEWLISPSLDLSGGSYELTYTAAITDWNNSDPPEGTGMGSDDEVQVLITSDNGATWTNLKTYNQADYPSETGDVETIDLSAYTGTVKIAFWATDGSVVDDTEDYDFFIDDFAVQSSVEPADYTINWETGISASDASITIEVGETVEWVFTDAASHSVTSDAGSTETFDSGILPAGSTYSYTFTTVGTNPYHCNVHPAMVGTVTVVPVSSGTGCNQTQVSNNFENALFMEEGGQLVANDFIVNGSTTNFSVESITANLFSFDQIVSIDIKFYDDNAGVPGTQIGATIEDLVPTSQTIIGSAFGYDVREVVLDLPTPIDFAGSGTGTDTTYWVQLVGVPTTPTPPDFNSIGWGVTTAGLIGNPTAFDNNTGTWNPTSDSSDGVFTIEGVCTYVACPEPTNLAVGTIDVTTAELSWDAVSNASLGYEWSVFATGDDPNTDTPVQTGTTPSGTTTAPVSGLTGATTYDAYVSSDCDADGTSFLAGPVTFETLIPPPVCGGNFYDTGGPSGDYQIDENVTWTITPVNPGDLVTVTFTAFNVEATWDALYVYDGPDDASPLIDSGNPETGSGFPAGGYYGTDIIGPFTSTDASGALTFVFMSDGSVVRSGWEADITCSSCPAPFDLGVDNVTTTGAELLWTEAGSATVWDIEFGPAGFAPTGTPTDNDVANPFPVSGLTAGTLYDFYVRADCGGGNTGPYTGPFTFSTLCNPVGDFFENFDDETIGTLPLCWDSIVNSTSTDAFASVQDSDSFSTPNNLELDNADDAGAEVIAITPPLTALPAQTHQIRFQAKTADDSVLEVGTMSDPNDETTFTLVQTITLTDSYQQYFVPFDAATTDMYVAFRATFAQSLSPVNIDDVYWEPIPPCQQPADLVVSNVSDTSVTLSWGAVTNAANGYEWSVFADGDDPTIDTPVQSGTTLSGTTTVDVSGLTADTPYDFYVSADCDVDGTSILSGPVSFRTAIGLVCGDAFTDLGGAAAPYGLDANVTWVIRPVNAGDAVTVIFTSFDVEATWDALYVYDGPDASFPLIDSGNPATGTGFPAGGYYGTDIPGPFTATDPSGALTFVFRSDDIVANPGWEAITTCASCPDPIGVAVESITDGSADVTWTPTGSETEWEVEYGPVGFTLGNGTIIQDTDGTPGVSIDGLDPDTTYDVYVTAICGPGDESNPVGPVSFTTYVLNGCGQSQASNNFENGFGMDEGGGFLVANDFIVPAGTINFSLETITGNFIVTGGITSMDIVFYEDNAGLPGTQIGATIEDVVPTSQTIIGTAFGSDVYEVTLDLPTPVDFVGDVSGSDDVTYWIDLRAVPTVPGTTVYWEVTTASVIGNSAAFTAATPIDWGHDPTNPDGVFSTFGICTPLGIEDQVLEGFSYYPNPVKNQLSLKANNKIDQVVVYDLLGQEVINAQPNSSNPTLKMGNLQAGVYLMKVTINGEIGIYRLVKE